MSNKYLFLGGPADGRRIKVADGLEQVEVHAAWSWEQWASGWELSLEPQPASEKYYKVVLCCLGHTGHEIVYTHDSQWTEFAIFNHLLEKYHEPPNFFRNCVCRTGGPVLP